MPDISTARFVTAFILCTVLLLMCHYRLVGWHGMSPQLLIVTVVAAAYYVLVSLVALKAFIYYS